MDVMFEVVVLVGLFAALLRGLMFNDHEAEF